MGEKLVTGGAGRMCVPRQAVQLYFRHRLQFRTLSSQIMVMDWKTLRDLCLALPGSQETFPFGPETSVFKVAGKMFALSRSNALPLTVSLKCEPVLAEQLRAAHAAITAGYHLNKRHWNTVTIDGSLPQRMIADMIEDSYDLVVSQLSRTKRHALHWDGDADKPTAP
jgi:predicted DNA-binding protein (MmcQ/YjbR family)